MYTAQRRQNTRRKTPEASPGNAHKKMSSVLKKARLNAANGTPPSPPSSAAATPALPQAGTSKDGQPESSSTGLASDMRLAALRECLRKRGVSAYLVETQDAHQSEYVSEHDKRRAWLTGFTGSAGTALVTATKALLWTDGRYFLQVE